MTPERLEVLATQLSALSPASCSGWLADIMDLVAEVKFQMARNYELGEALAQRHYLSTACFHDLHSSCRLQCKYCDTKCSCSCHVKAEGQ